MLELYWHKLNRFYVDIIHWSNKSNHMHCNEDSQCICVIRDSRGVSMLYGCCVAPEPAADCEYNMGVCKGLVINIKRIVV